MGKTKKDNQKKIRITDKRGRGEPVTKLLSAEEHKDD